MKWIHKVSPKILLICVSAGALLSLTAGSALAYLKADTQQADNHFTPGVIDIEVVEPNSSNYTIQSHGSVNKVVKVQNVSRGEHSASAYVRVKLVPIMRWKNGNSGSGDEVKVTYEVNSTNWWGPDNNGFYYYKGVLKPGDISPEVISSATVDNGIPPDKKLEIQVIADAVQVSEEATQKAWGKTFNGSSWSSLNCGQPG